MPKGSHIHRPLGCAALLACALLLPLPVAAHGGGGAVLRVLLEILGDGLRIAGPPPAPAVPAPVPVIVPVVPAAEPQPTDLFRDAGRLKDQDLLRVPPPDPKPLLMRDFTRSFYTMFGGSAADASALTQQDGLRDPAQMVSTGLAGVLTQQFGMRDAGSIPAVDTPPAVSAGYVLEVVTTRWELKSVSINPLHIVYGLGHYGIYYKARFRLTSRHDGSTAAKGDCDESPDREGAPTLDEALAGDGALIKGMLQSAAAACVADIEADYFHIPKPLTATD